MGPDGFGRVADAALALRGVDDVEVLFMHEWGALTRFAKSEIHQSTAREDTGLRVRVVTNGRVGVAATNETTPDGARAAAESAKEMAEIVGPDPLWPGLAPMADVASGDRFFEGTADSSPETRADAVAGLIGTCADGFTAAGAYETIALELGLANTQGQRCWAPTTQASVTTVITGSEGGSGFAEVFSGSMDTIDAGGDRAPCQRQGRGLPVAPGTSRRRVPGDPGATRDGGARGVPVVRGLLGQGLPGGSLVFQRQEGPAGGGAGRSRSGTTAATHERWELRSTSRACRGGGWI